MMTNSYEDQYEGSETETETRALVPISATAITLAERAKFFAGTAFGVGVGVELLGMGELGLLLALVTGGAAAYFSEEIRETVLGFLPAPRAASTPRGKLSWWITGRSDVLTPTRTEPLGPNTEQETEPLEANGTEHRTPKTEQSEQETEPLPAQRADILSGDAIFHRQMDASDGMAVPRLAIEEIVRHVRPNSYVVYIGRSLTRPGYPAIPVNLYKRHIKLIGASQKGKSSMAAAMLEIIARTHDPAHVLIVLLDLEDQTSNLFAHLPHIAEVLLDDGKHALLHARTPEQVLEHLNHVIGLIQYRYTLSKVEIAREPLVIVYLEEFIALKDYFKTRVDAVAKEEKEQAKRDYVRLVYCIKEIARRGLKAKVQLLMCAQVDYRDDDLQEALINVTSGISFAVRTTAAQAAGFYQSELLQRNARENRVGQAVVEMPDCRDLVLAPAYDLEQHLVALEQAERRAPITRPETAVSAGVSTVSRGIQNGNGGNTYGNGPETALQADSHPIIRELFPVSGQVGGNAESSVNEETPVSAETLETIRRMKDEGYPDREIARLTGLSGRKYPLYQQALAQLSVMRKAE